MKLTWGRSTVVDQPDASTCSFTVADKGGDADFLGLLHVGHVVDVYAAAPLSTGSSPVDVAVDGSFETAAASARVYVTGGTAATDEAQPAVDGRALRVTPSPAATVHIPPGPFSSSATAWNPIPQAAAGRTWTVSLEIALGGGCTGTLAVGLFTTPHTGPAAQTGTAVPVPASPGNTYQTVTASLVIPAGGPYWVGAVLVTTGTLRYLDAVGSYAAQTLTYRQIGSTWIDDLHVLAPPQASSRCMVFSGRITDLVAQGGTGGVQVSVTAADRFADLGNDYIGDNPWIAQSIATRVKRITALAATPVTVDVASWPGGRQVSWVDVDSQPVAGLLADLATTADAVLWSVFAANRGFYLWMEDTATRQAFNVFANVGGVVVIVGNPRPAGGVTISACDVAADVQWEQDVSDVLSIVDLTWLAQLTDDAGQPDPTETHVVLTDQAALAEYGQRRLGYATQLTNATDGGAVAQRLMSRSRALGWKASGVSWDTDLPEDFGDEDRAVALSVLDGSKRIGLPVVLTEMPAWTPTADDTVATYLEGGTYTFEGGRWRFEMTVSPSGLTGGSITYRQVDPSYQYRQFDPTIRYVDVYGVGAA